VGEGELEPGSEVGGGDDEPGSGAGGAGDGTEGLELGGGDEEPGPDEDPPPATGVEGGGGAELLSGSDTGWGSVSETAGPVTISVFAWLLFCRFASEDEDSTVAKT
jgi:hypothetical protein